MNRNRYVRDLVYSVLDKDDFNANYVTDVLLDDGGNCIHVTLKGDISTNTILAIGNLFGENNLTVYAEGDGIIKLVMINESCDDLKDY